jgi:hypothetical protein
MKKVSELPNHYSTIEDLTLYRWDKYTSTKDNNWFLVDYDGRQTKVNSDELSQVETSIQDQYFKAVNDRSFSVKMQKWSKIDWLKRKYEICNMLLSELNFTIQQEANSFFIERRLLYINKLKEFGFKFPLLNSVYEDSILIRDYVTSLDGIKTQIAILSGELKTDEIKEHASLLKQLRIVEIGLGYSYRLDPKKITVAEWIEELKLLEEKAKKN